MKKVLFVMHSLGYGGAERSLVNLLNELPEGKYQVDLLLFQRKGDFLLQLPPWVNVIKTPAALAGLYGPLKQAGRFVLPKLLGKACAMMMRRTRKAQAAWRWQHVFKKRIPPLEGHYDVAVAYTGAEIQYYVADCVSAKKKIVFIHNDYRTAGYSAADDEPYFARMDEIVSISRRCVEVLEEEFPQYRDRMHYLENITSSRVVRERAKAFLPEEYPQEGAVLLSVGRLWPQKGFDMAVDAAKILKDNGLVFRWYVIGEGSLRPELEKQISANCLTAEFVLLGVRNNPYPYMAHCDVLVQTSRYEGKSVVLDEAKMLCKPIVSTAYPTVADQVQDGREGIVTAMSPQGIADGICKMLENDALRQSVASYLAGREYGNQAEAENYMKLFDE